MERVEPRISSENVEMKDLESSIEGVYSTPESHLSGTPGERPRSGLKVMNIILMVVGIVYLAGSIFLSQNFVQSKANLVIQLCVSLMLIGAGYIPFYSITNGFIRKNKVLGCIANGLCIFTLILVGILLTTSVGVSFLYLLILGLLVIPFSINLLYFKGI